MIISTKLYGSGVEGDPFRANFPTYTIAAYDFDNARILVHVPDDCLPEGEWTEAELHAHFDKRYQELSGKFRPKVYARG